MTNRIDRLKSILNAVNVLSDRLDRFPDHVNDATQWHAYPDDISQNGLSMQETLDSLLDEIWRETNALIEDESKSSDI